MTQFDLFSEPEPHEPEDQHSLRIRVYSVIVAAESKGIATGQLVDFFGRDGHDQATIDKRLTELVNCEWIAQRGNGSWVAQ